MGMIPIIEHERFSSTSGNKYFMDMLTDTGELSCGEDGAAWISIDCVSGVDAGKKYGVTVPLDGSSESWIKRFKVAFAEIAVFRASFLLDEHGDPCSPSCDKLTLPPIPKLPDNISGKIIRGDIARLIKKGSKARFADFAGLKSGRDQYSSIKLPDLAAQVGDEAMSKLSGFTDDLKAKTARWILRGLPVDMAVRKTKTDAEIGENAVHRKR